MAAKSPDVSRRVFFQRAATFGAVATILPGLAIDVVAAPAKVPQNTVSYQAKPKGEQRCNGCSNFQPPSSCKLVDGEINPQGWCSLFTKKA